MNPSFPVEAIRLRRRSSASLQRQLYVQLRKFIEENILPSGAGLPATRVLAGDLGLGRNTVIAAYDQLALEGFIAIKRGTAPIVKALPARSRSAAPPKTNSAGVLSARGRLMSAQPHHHGKPGLQAFHPGLPDADNFPFNTWSKLLMRRSKLARKDLFGSYYIPGHPELCQAIARYLTASRGVACRPEQIIVTNGAQSAFDVLARLLIDPGGTVWMEEPGYYGAASAFISAGAKLEPLRVGDEGWRLDPPAVPPRVIFVTPSCQHPMGITMNMAQRLNLLSLADALKAWIIEDDYDSEYRFQGQPIPALQGISANARVVFVGTFAKILFPAMRLGYMVVPDGLRDHVIAALSVTGQFAPLITQAALADFINEGHLTRHLRLMRRVYAMRRQFFMDQFEPSLGDWMDLRRTDSGIQLIGHFRAPRDDRMLARRAADRGVNVSALSLHYRHKPSQSGLVLGFAAANERAMRSGFERLAEVFRNKD